MKLVVGLGNPGEKYEDTRHNVGYAVLNKVQTEISKSKILNSKQVSNTKFQTHKKFQADICIYPLLTSHNSQLILAKPTAYMNSSGVAVKSLATFYKLHATNIWIIHDDLDIRLGEYKIQKGVGPKVHGGIGSINRSLGTEDYWRVRIGVDNRHSEAAESTPRGPVRGAMRSLTGKQYVLQDFSEEEKKILAGVIEKAVNELIRKVVSRM